MQFGCRFNLINFFFLAYITHKLDLYTAVSNKVNR